jgi:FAD/FMN-containing dehydrogenase
MFAELPSRNGQPRESASLALTQTPAAEAPAEAASEELRQSWGRFPRVRHTAVVAPRWLDDLNAVWQTPGSLLPYGQGRSYGDSCLNEGGPLIETDGLRRLIAFDEATGVLRCEAGTTLAEILEFAVPRGWFLPTTPGTKFVSVGGAIANDVHGKNHHVAGTFGRHVARFELARSDGSRLVCSPQENADWYRATIGGLGLTGLITWAEVRLKPVSGPFIDMESVRFGSLDEFFEVSADSDERYEFTMSWIDCMATGASLGRGLFMRGNHAWQPCIPGLSGTPRQRLSVPFDLPSGLLTGSGVRAFNTLNYYRQVPKRIRRTVPFDPFFYPLDSIGSWNRLYGGHGFLQHQCVLPHATSREALTSILEKTSASGEGSFLAVLKVFGDLESPGLLSFPRPGATLALDFPHRGESTLRLLDLLDEIVIAHGGAVYPAKDARMSSATFEASFPHWRDLLPFIDERFSSSFWRRVTGGLEGPPG